MTEAQLSLGCDQTESDAVSHSQPGAASTITSPVAVLWWAARRLVWLGSASNTSLVALLSVWPPLALDHHLHSQLLLPRGHAEQSPWLGSCFELSGGVLHDVRIQRSGSVLLPDFQGFCPGKQQPCACHYAGQAGSPTVPGPAQLMLVYAPLTQSLQVARSIPAAADNPTPVPATSPS